jgi:hypothetical protein
VWSLKTPRNPILATLLVALSPALAFAGKSTDLKPILATPGKVSAEDSFTSTTLAKTWAVSKGDWQVNGGALVGKELAEDKHPAVCALNVPNHNSIIRLSFKLDGSKTLAVSYNYAKGHLFRVTITPTGLIVQTDKDKKDPNSKSEQLGKAEAKFEPGQWYTLQIELNGPKVAVQTDNGVKIEGSHASLDVDKTGYRFVTSGASVALADIKAWELAP